MTNIEERLACTAPEARIERADNIPLCQSHWNAWLSRYDPLFGDPAPCGAHLVRVQA